MWEHCDFWKPASRSCASRRDCVSASIDRGGPEFSFRPDVHTHSIPGVENAFDVGRRIGVMVEDSVRLEFEAFEGWPNTQRCRRDFV